MYRRYKANEIFLSFNGGKDCTVVLHLAATLAQLRKLDNPLCLYVTGDAFPEVCFLFIYFLNIFLYVCLYIVYIFSRFYRSLWFNRKSFIKRGSPRINLI